MNEKVTVPTEVSEAAEVRGLVSRVGGGLVDLGYAIRLTNTVTLAADRRGADDRRLLPHLGDAAFFVMPFMAVSSTRTSTTSLDRSVHDG